MIEQLNKGKTVKQLQKELRAIDKKKAKEPGKCFGEAATANGEW